MRGTLKWLAMALFVGAAAALQAQTPDVGQKAPEFTLSSPGGTAVSLAEVEKKGRVVLVLLRGFPGYQCPYCTRQVHDFVENADKFAALGAQVLLVYPGPAQDLDQRAREFLVKQNPLPENVILVVDPDYKFTNQYGLRWEGPKETAYPSTFVLGQDGRILFRKISREHGDRTSAADVLAELAKASAHS